MSDMLVFKVSTWTTNPDAIPRSSELLLPVPNAVDADADPDRAFRLALGLDRFPVRIHVAACDDYRRPLPPPPPPFGDDDMGFGSPPLPPRWPQHHQFPPATPQAGARRSSERGGRRRRHAAVPLPSRGWLGILWSHPLAHPTVSRAPVRQHLGASSALAKAASASPVASDPSDGIDSPLTLNDPAVACAPSLNGGDVSSRRPCISNEAPAAPTRPTQDPASPCLLRIPTEAISTSGPTPLWRL